MTATRPFTARQRSSHAPAPPAATLSCLAAVCSSVCLSARQAALVTRRIYFMVFCRLPFLLFPISLPFFLALFNKSQMGICPCYKQRAESSGKGVVQEGGGRVKGNGQRWQSLCKVAFNMFTTKHFRLLVPRRLMGYPLSLSHSISLSFSGFYCTIFNNFFKGNIKLYCELGSSKFYCNLFSEKPRCQNLSGSNNLNEAHRNEMLMWPRRPDADRLPRRRT